jgi:hypothetical protein
MQQCSKVVESCSPNGHLSLKTHPQCASSASVRILSLKAHPQPQGASSASRRILSLNAHPQPQCASSASMRILSLNAHPQPQCASSAAFTAGLHATATSAAFLLLHVPKWFEFRVTPCLRMGWGSIIKEVGVAGVSQDIPAPRVLIEVAPQPECADGLRVSLSCSATRQM